MLTADDLTGAVEQLFRRESGKIIASLIRFSGSFDLAEEAMQDAFAAALTAWRAQGVPDNPAAWITRTAQRKLIDRIRRDRTREDSGDQLLYETAATTSPEFDAGNCMDFPDDRLRLIFTCCHPAINMEAQVALTLRTLGGLTTPEIARAFLLPEATLAQRLVRAKRKIQAARIPYQVPSTELLPERLRSVQAVLYLIFNEGYSAAAGDSLVRRELCAEAIRLARILCDLMPGDAESMGLLALMLLHDSRRDARISEAGELVPLEEQDRTRWHRDQIAEGEKILEAALRLRDVGPYQLQAAIAALHAQAVTPSETDWKQIAALYRELARTQATPVILLNHAVAVALSDSLAAGLALLAQIECAGGLESYYLFYAARADLLRRKGDGETALEDYRRALSLATNPVERRYLCRRIDEIQRATSAP